MCLSAGLFVTGGVHARSQQTAQARPDGQAGRTSEEIADSSTPLAMTAGSGVGGAVPRLIRFSGRLKDLAGQPKSGVVGVTFAIFADKEGGAPLWMETQNVESDEVGSYTVLLGANRSEGVPMELFNTGQPRWLGVEAQGVQQPPRVLLVSVPYALKAADAETLGGLPVSAFVVASGSTALGNTTGSSGLPALAGPASASSTITAKPKAAQATTSTTSNANYLVKFDTTNNLVPSVVYESNGKVGISTVNPSAPFHIYGDTVKVTSGTTAQVQVSGSASSGRFGQDSSGTFLASDSSGSALRFLTNNGNLKEWMRIGSNGNVNVGTAQSAQNGEAVFAPDNLDTVHSVIGQAGSQYHFRLSRATPDLYGFKDFLITPYTYGMAVEYPGTLEFWTGSFSVHMNPRCPVSSLCGPGANLWVGDEIDSGGLYVTAMNNSGGNSSTVTLAADRFTHASHGSLNFVVRNTTDAFKFDMGPFGSEVMKAQISTTASASNMDLYNGPVQATLRAQNGSSVDAEIGSTSNHPMSLFANNGAARATLFPSGNFSIGNSSDAAPLAVGTAAQFQVSPAGAVTIGGGNAITRHISVSASLAFPQFAPLSCSALSFPVAGAADGNSVALGVPNALAAINGLTWFGWVSAPGIVSVRGCNATNQTVPAPPAANVRVDVWQH